MDKKKSPKPAVQQPSPKAAAKPASAKPPAVGAGASDGKKKKARRHSKRNYILSSGVYRFSKSKMYHKKAIYKFKGKKTPKAPKAKQPQFAVKQIGGEKNGGTRLVRIKKPRAYYPTGEKRVRRDVRPHQLFKHHKRHLRKSLTPGTVCILVAGPHRGKRVIFLKQLKSGLLLVTGPFRINACPLRRINQIYVIATKTVIDLKGVKIPANLNDEYFRRKHTKRPKKAEGDIFTTKKEGYKPSDERKKDQDKVDDRIIKALKQNHPKEKKMLCNYLGSFFQLRSGQYPHRLVF